MIILQDTREQTPLEFNHPWISNVEVSKLEVGDYGVRFNDGFTPDIFFERKTISDLYGTLSKGYKRFKKEINRSIEFNSMLIIIVEGSLTKVLKGYKHSTRKPESIVKQMFTLMVKHHVPFVCCSNAKEMSEYITRFFIAIGEQRVKDAKGTNKRRSKKTVAS